VSGEKPAYRQAMERLTERLVNSGVPADKARKAAQDAAQRADRKERDKR
jgi:pyrroline-5-carboxylate reductase